MTDDVVEAQVEDGRVVGLVRERRTDGQGAASQKRLVIATSQDDDLREIDTAAERVAPVDGAEADLVRDIVGDRLEGDI